MTIRRSDIEIMAPVGCFESLHAAIAAGADAVYFVNSKEKVIAAGVQPAEAYDESNLDASLTQVPMKQIEYEDAAALLK